MQKTVKIVNLAFNQEFLLDKKKFISKGRCHVNNNYMTAIQLKYGDNYTDGIHYFNNDTNVEIELKQIRLKDIVPGKKFKILNYGTIYTKLEKDSTLIFNHELHDYSIVLYETTKVTIINSHSYVYPVE